MRFGFLLMGWILVLLNRTLVAQPTFDRLQREVLQSSAAQWLSRELQEVNPRYFDCASPLWTLPGPGAFALYGRPISLDASHISRFVEVWFPGGDCKQFLAVVAMADVYLPLFKKKAEQQQLHPDVAYLPVVLSGCNQQFTSGDASGLWALPYLAARKQHLRVDTLVDERKGGDFTTDAALRHWSYMLGVQRGDYWRACVAYSYGVAQVASVDTSLHGQNLLDALSTDAADFLRFQAYTIQLLRNVRTENQLSNCFDILGHFQPVAIDQPMRVQAIAEVLRMEESRVRATNPVFTGTYLVPGYRRVPFVLEDTLLGRFNAMKDSIARWQPPKPALEEVWETTWISHRVGKGESLGRIAGKYHVSVSQLKKWNKLRSDKIRKGQVLKIEQRRKVKVETPVLPAVMEVDLVTDSIQTVAYTLANPPSPVISAPSPQAPRPTTSKYYTVKRGDSLWSIAKKYPGVTEQDLMKWNKCGADIRPGQKLRVASGE